MLADARGETVVAEVAEDHPELEAAEAAPELDAVLGVVADGLMPWSSVRRYSGTSEKARCSMSIRRV